MGRVEDLAELYEQHISLPWQEALAGAQRVIMVVYAKELERTLRAKKGEFEQRTVRAGHKWIEFDCTKLFADWMANEEYKESFFEVPEDLALFLEGAFTRYAGDLIRNKLQMQDMNTVTALTGVASLYGFLRVSELVRCIEPFVKGRLVVFFPGNKEGNNYRLLDARDGWNYLAHSISLSGV